MRGSGEALDGGGLLGLSQVLRPGPKADGPGYPGFHGLDGHIEREDIQRRSNGVRRASCGHPREGEGTHGGVHHRPGCGVEDSINTMEQLLAKDDKYKVVDFDLQYTAGRPGVDQAVVVAQLCVGHHVLVYYCCLATRPCERFARFVKSPNYKFSTVDTVNDVKAL
jgi:hypothetical protein